MILLHTTYIVSFLVNTEKNHERALELSKKLHKNELIITNVVLTETMNLLRTELNKNTKAMVKVYKSIKNNFKVYMKLKS